MSDAPRWPGGARGALGLSFDNLGEAAELELGAIGPEAPLGDHFTATRVLPALLEALGERGLAATFFVEGLNAEVYPDLLREIASRGHELAYHAWRHEQWGELDAEAQAENLSRGIAAFEKLGIAITGMRPPGGELGEGGLDVLREAGLRYCSPAREAAGDARGESGMAILPFAWRHVDASCTLPGLSAAREEIAGSPDPIEPAAFLAYLEAEIDRLATEGGFATFILHPVMLDWFGENLAALLDKLAASDVWVARCDEVAAFVS